MKFVFCFFMVIFFMSCRKDPEKPTLSTDYWGEAKAERNGNSWTASPACWIDVVDKTNIAIEMDSLINNYYLKESLIIAHVPPVIGTYKVNKLTTGDDLYSYLSIWDADLPLGGYSLLESDSSNNYVSLTFYDTFSKEIKGVFSLTFVVEQKPYLDYPDTIRIRNGQFHGKLVKK